MTNIITFLSCIYNILLPVKSQSLFLSDVWYNVSVILNRKRWIHDEICCSLLCYSRRRYSCTLYLPMDRQQTINKPNKHGTLPPCVLFSTRRFQCKKSPAHYNHVIKAGDFFILLIIWSDYYFTTRTLETPSIAFSSSSASLEAAHFRGALFEK